MTINSPTPPGKETYEQKRPAKREKGPTKREKRPTEAESKKDLLTALRPLQKRPTKKRDLLTLVSTAGREAESGEILSKGSSFFLPQRVYMPHGSLTDCLCYPQSQEQHAPAAALVCTRIIYVCVHACNVYVYVCIPSQNPETPNPAAALVSTPGPLTLDLRPYNLDPRP